MKVSLSVREKGAGAFVHSDKQVSCTLKPGESREFELQVRNDAVELNKGDARCTPLLRIDEKIPEGVKVSFASADGKEITNEILARGNFDGYFLCGLEPGETKIVTLKMERPADPSAATAGSGTSYWNQLKAWANPPTKKKAESLSIKLYWNPQDPCVVVRDKASFLL